jgi:hypothetical protein
MYFAAMFVLAILLIGFLFIAAVVVLVVVLIRKLSTARLPSLPQTLARPRIYFPRKYLMSRGEAVFYRVLLQAVARQFVVMAKVRLSDLVDVRATGRVWSAAFNRVCRKHVDFVLLDPQDLTIKLIIELDDRSHKEARRMDRDEFVDDVLREAGIPLLRVKAAAGYVAADLADQIRHTAALV